MKLVPIDRPTTENVGPEAEAPIEVGQWYWVKPKKDDDDAEDVDEQKAWLGCVVHVGSNYVKVKSAETGGSRRISFQDFDATCERTLTPEIYIRNKISSHQETVRGLLDDVKRITAQLGVAPREQLTEAAAEAGMGLAVAHGTSDIKAHKKALIKAKEKTLPDLFKRIGEEHEMMAKWMKAEIIPAQAEADRMEGAIDIIEDRIFTVELYAGLEGAR